MLILSPIQLDALGLDLPVAQEYTLIRFHHSDICAGDQGHGHHYLNQPKPPIAVKMGCMGLRYGWAQSAYLWFLHSPILRGCGANFYQAIRLLSGKSAVDRPFLPPALKIAAYAYNILRYFCCAARQSLLDPRDHC
jgi:hypothetical protein